MRRAGTRMLIALIIVLVLATFFTAGGISLTAAGELPGLPLAVGGAYDQEDRGSDRQRQTDD